MTTTRHRRGFSLVELLVVIGIMGLFVSVATFSYIRYLDQVAIESASSTVSAVLNRARQVAVATRTARRVALDLARDQMVVHRKIYEQFEFDQLIDFVDSSGQRQRIPNWRQIGEVTRLQNKADIVDVSGWGPDDIDGPDKIYYIQFDTQGRNAKGYRLSAVKAGEAPPNEGMAIHVSQRAASIVLPSEIPSDAIDTEEKRRTAFSILENTRGRLLAPEVARKPSLIPGLEGNPTKPLWDNKGRTSELANLIGNLKDYNDTNSKEAWLIGAEQYARKRAHTVLVLRVTGKVHVFEYGIGFPWSDIEMAEVPVGV